ncbi:GNAT family N-acetyltransferase [Rummeliibacillus pycnus]|uniref:GNAT family N-acetyltransferase n=1 Tax=Rummeliibacillus pycnus TaxID=101070 RepID=UPI001FE428E3|nr:GNAT family N-acetyltransferase [Rummeliibacillus pycnus]
MEFDYVIFTSIPKGTMLDNIFGLHTKIFGEDEKLKSILTSKPKLLTIVALDGDNVIGYKLGYELNQDIFYSWLGGVAKDYRNQGIATTLMEKQHLFLKESGYRSVQTKTMNKWRSMLIVNIKSGFDIVETQVNRKGIRKILLQKNFE